MRRQENKSSGKKEDSFTDEQRAYYCKWILDNKCWHQEYYFNKFKKHMINRVLPDLEGKMITPNSYGGMDIHDVTKGENHDT